MALFSTRSAEKSPAVSYRGVRPDDAERILRVLQVSFEDENQRMGMQRTRLPTMTDGLLDFYLARGADHSQVAEGRGGIVGFCLACRWGSVAWMGPIAVLPPAQGAGIGRRLVERTAASLREAGVETLGLETMPRSYRNLQFYTSLGMRIGDLTLDVSRLLDEEAGTGGDGEVRLQPLSALTGMKGQEGLEEIGRIGEMVAPGLDYRPEAEHTLRSGVGDVLLVRTAGTTAGFAVAHTVPYAVQEAPGTVRVNTLLLPADAGPEGPSVLFPQVAAAIEAWILRIGCDAVTWRVPSARYDEVRVLAGRGYRITHSDVRMTYEDLPVRDRPDAIHLSKWE